MLKGVKSKIEKLQDHKSWINLNFSFAWIDQNGLTNYTYKKNLLNTNVTYHNENLCWLGQNKIEI